MLFLYALYPHRYLHSFPTRRSSDLCRCRSTWVSMRSAMSRAAETTKRSLPHLSTRDRDSVHRYVPSTNVEASASRSEEHTSELQSPVHLVCRLLLEKKNKNSSNHVR